MPKIVVTGLDEIIKKLGKDVAMDLVKECVRVNGGELQEKMTNEAEFVKGYSVGDTKRSIDTVFSDGGLTATVEPHTHYSPYLEYGTRFMEAQPFVRPAFDAQKEQFKKDMEKLVR